MTDHPLVGRILAGRSDAYFVLSVKDHPGDSMTLADIQTLSWEGRIRQVVLTCGVIDALLAKGHSAHAPFAMGPASAYGRQWTLI